MSHIAFDKMQFSKAFLMCVLFPFDNDSSLNSVLLLNNRLWGRGEGPIEQGPDVFISILLLMFVSHIIRFNRPGYGFLEKVIQAAESVHWILP